MLNYRLFPYGKLILSLSSLSFLSGCSSTLSDANLQEKPDKLHAAYSMFAPSSGGDTILYARVIVDGSDADCPTLSGSDSSTIVMSTRGYHPDSNANTQNFPVTVCEATILSDVSYSISSSSIQIDSATLNPSSVLVYGDTGCKSSVCKKGEAASPFNQLAQSGAGASADLILHMGDYNYRGTSGSIRKKPTEIYAYDAGDGGYGGNSCGYVKSDYYSQNASDSPKPDSWQYWHDDFFKPAKELLPTAPWVFTRGNHELCSRAGVGWFYFLGPGSSLEEGIPQLTCPNQGTLASPANGAANSIAMIQPYSVSLKPMDVWVIDSANACDTRAGNSLTTEYTTQFEKIQKDGAASGKPAWMVTHRPTWGASVESAKTADSSAEITSINIMMQTALRNTASTHFPEELELLLSGHMHLFQSVSFLDEGSERPGQIVIGNSGVSLNKSPQGNYQSSIDGEEASINQLTEYGFLSISLNADGSWSGDVLSVSGSSIASCNSKNVSESIPVCNINDPQ